MAILNKRRSTNQLPQLQQRSIYEPFVNLEAGERGREILRPSGVQDRGNLSTRPVTSVVQGERSPSLGGVGRQPPTGGGASRPVTSTTSGATAPRTSLTSTGTTKPAVTTAKPSITSKTTAPATKTQVTPTAKPKVTKSTGTTNKLGTALTGAALGATTKAVIDKIKGSQKTLDVKPPISSVVKPPVAPVVKPPGTPKPPVVKPPVIPGTPKPPVVKPPVSPVVKPPVVKPPITSSVKPTGTPPFVPKTAVKPPVTKPPVTKPPITKPPAIPKTAGQIKAENPTLTDEEVQAELDRVRAEEEGNVVPEGVVTNEDGSYSVTEDGMTTTYGADGSIIGMEAADTVVEGDGTDTTSGSTRSLTGGTGDATVDSEDTSGMTDLGEGYFQDASGNIYGADGNLMYTVGDDGEYIDASTIGESTYDETTYVDPETGDIYNLGEDGNWTLEGGESVSEDETTYTDPETGFTWNQGADGEWTQEGFDDTGYDDTSYDETDYSLDNTDYSFDDSDYSFDEDFKRGGLAAALMKRGGKVRHFDEGGYSDTNEEVQDFQNVGYNYGEFDEPSMTGDNSLYSQSGPLRNTYLRSALASEDDEGIEYPYNPNRLDTVANNEPSEWYNNDDGTFSRWEGDQYVTVDGETSTELSRTDSDGNPVTVGEEVQDWQNVNESGTVGDANYSTDELGNIVYTDNDGNQTFYDPQGNLIQTGDGSITSTGSVGGSRYRKEPPPPPPPPAGGLPNTSGILDSITDALGTYTGSAAAGALLASLLEAADSGGGGGGDTSGIDMSQVGVLNPRTTDFGIGPARYVGYDEYGAQDEMPEMYGNELYKNLNAPGFNPVNEGDYADPESVQYGDEGEMAEATEEAPQMADGGAAYQTHYTFGKSVDPLVNLGLKGGQPMKSGGLSHGGLPAFSNVPITQGRLNFKKGAPVHGPGDGQSDDIPAMLADGEYVIDAETVAQIGNGSTKAGAHALDKFRENIRAHKRSAPINKIPPKTKALTSYLRGAK